MEHSTDLLKTNQMGEDAVIEAAEVKLTVELVAEEGQENFIRAEFVERMNAELIENSERKGDWKNWRPDKMLLSSELNWHLGKLLRAILEDNRQRVSEYAADVANYAMKADEIYGQNTIKTETDAGSDLIEIGFGWLNQKPSGEKRRENPELQKSLW